MTHEHIDSVTILDDIKDEPDLSEATVGMGTTHISRPLATSIRGTRTEEGFSTQLFYPEQFLVLGTAIVRANRLSPEKAKSMGVTLTKEEIDSMLAAGRKLLAETPGLEAKMPTAQGALYQSMTYLMDNRSQFEGLDTNPDLSLSKQIMKIMLGMSSAQLMQLRREAGAGDLPLRRMPVA